MNKMGRPKKYENLRKLNVYVEGKTLDLLLEMADELNKKKDTDSYNLSSVIREILDGKAKEFLRYKSKKLKSEDQFSWKPESGKKE